MSALPTTPLINPTQSNMVRRFCVCRDMWQIKSKPFFFRNLRNTYEDHFKFQLFEMYFSNLLAYLNQNSQNIVQDTSQLLLTVN